MTTRSLRVTAMMAAMAVLGVLELAPVIAHEGHGMPALLQTETCDSLGGSAFELVGVGAEEDADGLPIAPPAVVGPESAVGVTTSTTTVAATVEQIVSGGHAIVVYASDEEMHNPVACGEVGGIQVGEDLIVGLKPVGDDGQSGVALLRTAGSEATVTIFLTEGSEHGHDAEEGHSHDETAGTPEA